MNEMEGTGWRTEGLAQLAEHTRHNVLNLGQAHGPHLRGGSFRSSEVVLLQVCLSLPLFFFPLKFSVSVLNRYAYKIFLMNHH